MYVRMYVHTYVPTYRYVVCSYIHTNGYVALRYKYVCKRRTSTSPYIGMYSTRQSADLPRLVEGVQETSHVCTYGYIAPMYVHTYIKDIAYMRTLYA